MIKRIPFISILLLNLLLSCSCTTTNPTPATTKEQDGPPKHNIDVSKIKNAIPKQEAYSRYGNPPKYSVAGNTYTVMKTSKNYSATGIASWYGTKFYKKRTSSGETYNMYAMTAAHKTLPIPCYARVTNLENKRQIIVKINDRGPFNENRIIDLSYVAAQKLGITGKGTGLVEVDTIDPKHPYSHAIHMPSHHPQIYLQVGSFAQKANAQKLAHQVKRYTTYPINLANTTKNHHHYYQVQIGPLKSVASSDVIHSKLKYAGLSDALTVVR